jgi:TolA-binding protein
LATLQSALGQRPDSARAGQASLLVARIYDRQGKLDAAMAAYNEVHNRHPHDPASAEALLRLADLVQLTKQPDRVKRARDYLTEVVTTFPNGPAAPRALGSRALMEEREKAKVTDPVLSRSVPAALLTFREIAEHYPTSPQAEGALWRLSEMYDDLKRYDLAAQALVDLGTHFPANRNDPWWAAGEIFEKRLKDPARARDAYSRVPSTSRRHADAQKKLK